MKVGDKLWLVYHRDGGRTIKDHGKGREVTVVSVGRKWAKLSDGHPRLHIETMLLDGGAYSAPGSCWESKEAFEAVVSVRTAWENFRYDVSQNFNAPLDITTEQIETARKVLNLEPVRR